MHDIRLLIAALVLSATTGVPFHAAEKDAPKKVPPRLAELLKGDVDQFIRQLDKNKDGFLSKEELPGQLAQAIEKADRNGDGKLDKKEVEPIFQALQKRFGSEPTPATNQPEVERVVANLLEKMDANKDGKLSKSEAKGPLSENFDRLDANKDGSLDKEELRRAAARFREAQRGSPEGRGGPDFDSLDNNADGRLTREELKNTPFAAPFEQMDANKDGKIDRKEWEAYQKKAAEKKDSGIRKQDSGMNGTVVHFFCQRGAQQAQARIRAFSKWAGHGKLTAGPGNWAWNGTFLGA